MNINNISSDIFVNDSERTDRISEYNLQREIPYHLIRSESQKLEYCISLLLKGFPFSCDPISSNTFLIRDLLMNVPVSTNAEVLFLTTATLSIKFSSPFLRDRDFIIADTFIRRYFGLHSVKISSQKFNDDGHVFFNFSTSSSTFCLEGTIQLHNGEGFTVTVTSAYDSQQA